MCNYMCYVIQHTQYGRYIHFLSKFFSFNLTYRVVEKITLRLCVERKFEKN